MESSLFARARPLVLARAASVALSFAIPLALARQFSQADYGTYKLLLLVSQTLYYVVPFGIPQALYYFLPRSQKPKPYLTHTMLALTAIAASTLVALLLGARSVGSWLNNPELANHALWLGLFTFGTIVSSPIEIQLTAMGKTRLASMTYIVSDGVKAIAMVVPALLGLGVGGVMRGLAAFALIRAAVAWPLTLGTRGPLFDRSSLSAQMRYALPFGAAVALAIPQQYFHQYFVSARVDSVAFAIYSVGLFQLPLIGLLYNPTSEILMVSLGELDHSGRPHEGAAVFRDAVAKLAMVFVPVTALLLVAAPSFIAALFTPRYLGSVPIFRIGILGTLLACLPIDGVLRARGETWHIFLSYVIKALITVPLVVLGVTKLGLMGGVGAWLAAEVIGKAALFWRMPRALGTLLGELLPWRDLGRTAMASLIAAGLAGGASALWGPSAHALLTLTVMSLAYAAGYLAALLALGSRLPLNAALPWRRSLERVP
jgi:O-antigen/teichoic acid export membrane protein